MAGNGKPRPLASCLRYVKDPRPLWFFEGEGRREEVGRQEGRHPHQGQRRTGSADPPDEGRRTTYHANFQVGEGQSPHDIFCAAEEEGDMTTSRTRIEKGVRLGVLGRAIGMLVLGELPGSLIVLFFATRAALRW